MKPNFFIVGATKSGTTTLWKHLSANNQVFMTSDYLSREPSFFSWRRDKQKLDDYLALFGGATEKHKIIGDASATYLQDEKSARLIYDFNKDAKIIIMLRNPVDRGFSLYRWMVQEGYEWVGTYEKAVKFEEERIKKGTERFFAPNPLENYLYFTGGFYFEQVKRYKDIFGKNLLVVNLDFFNSDFDNVYKDICNFLEINVNVVETEVFNKSTDVISPKLQFLIRKINDTMNLVKLILGFKIVSKSKRDVLLRYGFKNNKQGMSKTLRKYLNSRYINDLRSLSALLGKDFTYWCK